MKTYILHLWANSVEETYNFQMEIQMEDLGNDGLYLIGEIIAKAIAPRAGYHYMEEKE